MAELATHKEQVSFKSYLLCQTLVALDPVVTWVSITLGATEFHPIWSGLINKWGLTEAMIFRMMVGTILIYGVALSILKVKELTPKILTGISIAFFFIVSWNIMVILTA